VTPFVKQPLSSNANASVIVRVVNALQSNLASIFKSFQGPVLNAVSLPSVSLITGANLIPTQLGRAVTGWWITRQRSAATIYDTQDTNTNPQYLRLVSSAPVVVDLMVF